MLVSHEHNLQHTAGEIYARHEVILSAGAYHTPQILKLSGIGERAELEANRIRVVHNSPGVGTNLYDHMSMPVYVSINTSMSITKDKVLNVPELLRYLRHGDGLFSHFGVTGMVRVPGEPYAVGIFGTGSIDENALRDISNFRSDVK